MENKEKSIDQLLKDLYNLAHIKLFIVDEFGNEKKFFPSQYTPFCSLLRKDKKMDDKCKECDKKAYEYCKQNKSKYAYICHAGMYESFSPILYDDKIVGFIGCGQIKSKNSKFVISKDNPNYHNLLEAYNQLHLIDDKTIESTSRILEALSSYEYLKAIISSVDQNIDFKINEYINSNINKYISVELLCDTFHLSRSELYSIFDKYMHLTPAEYIKKRKIEKACSLLTETNKKVSTIGEMVGFDDYNYFSKVFKKEMNISPSSYRKKNKPIF